MSTSRSIDIQEGHVDTSGGFGSFPNDMLSAFPIPEDLLRTRDDDLFGQAGYRFWIVVRDQRPILAVEQTCGVAWICGQEGHTDLMRLYRGLHRNVCAVAANLLKQVEHL